MSDLEPSTRIVQSRRTASRVVSGSAVVVVIDAQELHTLNEVGTRVWQLAQSTSLSDIARTIAEEYDVAYDAALADVRSFAGTLLSGGMVEVVAP